ncbi:MAG: hypothetical protein Phog2KO_15140 [Phototrophicaceae bacterium]
MSIIGLSSALTMLLILLAFVAVPLLRRQQSTQSFSNKQRERALSYYERVLTNIRDLDDDLATDKIHQDEYQLERERWMERGVELLKMLDELDKAQNIISDENANDADIDLAIENAISNKQAQAKA